MKRVTEDQQVRRVQLERRGQGGIQGCQEVQGTSACKVHLVHRGRGVVLASLGQRAGGGPEVQMAHWENQGLRASRVKGVTLEKKESRDS